MDHSQPFHSHHDIIYPDTIPFVISHLICLAVFWAGVNAIDIWICLGLFWSRMLGVTMGYHRYFSHKSFSTGRWLQFVLAWWAQSSAQQGALWWASTHRQHHKYSDTAMDVHSPRQHGFWFSHVGWIFTRQEKHRDYSNIKDLTKYPELVWLDRWEHLPAVVLAVIVQMVAGWSGLIVGFFVSTVITWHCTFMINSVAHVMGRPRYITGDDSKNNWWLAILAHGEGWHNNHHYYQSAARNGFMWWEYDVTYYVIWLLSKVGIVWDLKHPPREAVLGERRLPKKIADRAQAIYEESGDSSGVMDTSRSRWKDYSGLPLEVINRAVSAPEP